MEKFYSFKTLLKMAGEGMHTPHPTPPGSAPDCIITKNGLKQKTKILFVVDL